MRRHLTTIGILLLALIVFFGVQAHTQLARLDGDIRAKWTTIEPLLQARGDLIPPLVQSLQGPSEPTRGAIEEVARQRRQWNEARTAEARAEAATRLEGALSRLLALASQDPAPSASASFVAHQEQLAATGSRIDVERRRYNEAVREYNLAIRRFPLVIFAPFLGFRGNRPYFEAAPGAAT